MSDPFVCTGGVKISNIWLINPYRDRAFWLEISHNGQATKQSEKKRVDKDKDRILWPKPFLFPGDITDQSVFDFKVVRTRSGLHFGDGSKIVGSCKQKVSDLFRLQKDSGSCKLDVSGGCHLIFEIKRLNDILPELINDVEEKKDTHASTLECIATITNGVRNAQDAFVDQFEPFLSQFRCFMAMMDKIAEVHPYVTLAWGVLSVIPKAITSQNNRDDSINALIGHMKEVYEYITDAKRLPTFSETQTKTLALLVQQTIECAYFVREYRASNIVIKTLKGISIDDKVEEFNQKFDHILSVLTNSIILESNIVTLRVSNTIRELKSLTLLGEMPCAADVGFSSEKSCLPGTRKQFIAEILDWINSGPERLLLLIGQAGTGKSAVAHTISQIFQKQNRLGSFFCFSRSYKERRNRLFSTMSRHIADGDVEWRESLIRIIEEITVRSSKDITTQFNKLIIEPSKEVKTIGPVVIIIDALDESGDRPERVELLNLLRRCSELPSTYRFVITSRPEPDILQWCEHPTIFCKYMSSIHLNETTRDIQDFISSRLFPVKDILDNEVGVGWESLLAKRAEGLFQWASTVCDLIDPTVRFGVAEQAKTFISGPTSSLYQLYHQIIIGQPEFRRTGFLAAFKTVTCAIIHMREPLSVHALQSLFHNDVESILQPFHSLFLGIHDSHTPVRPLHSSLTDFLTTSFIDIVNKNHEVEKIENPFYVDISDQGYFTLACFKLLNDAKNGLRFNICNLETSHKRNRDVSDLDRRIQESIPSHLAYASCFWAIHLQQSKITEGLLKQLHTLMHTNLLYWFEVLSLLRKVQQICTPMEHLVVSFKVCPLLNFIWVCTDRVFQKMHKHELAGKIEDAWKFGYDFGRVMMESTPHLYLSALPFARNDSFIRKQFLELFPRQFSIDIDHHYLLWFIGSVVSRRNGNLYPTVVAFSPRGRYIAIAFDSGEFWLWDFRDGEIIYQWRSKSEAICSIVFSSDGESVFLCLFDGSSFKLDVQDRELISCSDDGMSGLSCLHSTISNDGHYLAFHLSESNEILLYETVARSKILLPVACNSDVGSVFSPKGELLAFFNDTCTVSLWSTRTRKIIGSLPPLEERVNAMAFSPNGRYLGLQGDSSVEVWDVVMWTSVSRCIRSQRRENGTCDRNFGNRLVFFPNGRDILSGWGCDYYVWNTLTRELVRESTFFQEITSLAVSPDCNHVASITKDGMIYVQKWEAVTLPKSSDELGYTNHTYLYAVSAFGTKKWGSYFWMHQLATFTTLAFSFTGDRLLSGDHNGRIIIWNILDHTCELISRPNTIRGSKVVINALAFSTTGTQFLVAYTSHSKHLIEIKVSQSGETVKGPFANGLGNPKFAAFSTNDSHIVCIFDMHAVVLDAGTGQVLQMFLSPVLESISLSPSRKYIVWKDETHLKLWDMDKGVAVEGKWLNRPVTEVAFSNNSEEIITMDETGEINIWNIYTGDEIMRPMFHHDKKRYANAKLSSNGRHLALVEDGITIVWSLETHHFMSRTNEHDSKNRDSDIFLVDHSEEFRLGFTREAIHDRRSLDNWDRETIEYALVAQEKALFSNSSIMDNRGWVLGPNGELLFWIPYARRAGLWRPNMMHIAGTSITKLNFENFVHGLRWTECKETLSS
ncbi:hypothetical protein Clacol_006867 [Clathrus columnatus]|uniref:NACHT domain-containing protein n=1 Tax=Clathrus columnatus TaxID=1419009 RepID=A0AAV5AIW4_9AGAM|nr:hypothetical protein Clacol_006867 [Clathrus columnatus]